MLERLKKNLFSFPQIYGAFPKENTKLTYIMEGGL